MADERSTGVGNVKGFTLIESILAAAIAAILGGVMYTILRMHNDGIALGAVSARIQMQYGTMVDQIGQKARAANAVAKSSGETWSDSMDYTPDTAASVYMYDTAGHNIGGYQIAGTALQEWVSNKWQNFHVGNNDVTVLPGSCFYLGSSDRKSLTLRIAVVSTVGNRCDTTLSKQELFLCRN
jgi:prepilin-type N-terminal cleavage/methylation domain-containing protein